MEVSTLSGAVIDAGMSVVIFILGGWAQAGATRLVPSTPGRLTTSNRRLIFILVSPSLTWFQFEDCRLHCT